MHRVYEVWTCFAAFHLRDSESGDLEQVGNDNQRPFSYGLANKKGVHDNQFRNDFL